MSTVKYVRDGRNLTATFELDATVDQVWRLFEEPQLLEQWWGPPGWPATFSRFEFAQGGEARYHMTGPDGTESHGWWTFDHIDFPSLTFTDGFSDSEGVPDLTMPYAQCTVRLDGEPGRVRVTFESVYDSEAALDRVTEMGFEEGFSAAVSQIPGVLASGAASSA